MFHSFIPVWNNIIHMPLHIVQNRLLKWIEPRAITIVSPQFVGDPVVGDSVTDKDTVKY